MERIFEEQLKDIVRVGNLAHDLSKYNDNKELLPIAQTIKNKLSEMKSATVLERKTIVNDLHRDIRAQFNPSDIVNEVPVTVESAMRFIPKINEGQYNTVISKLTKEQADLAIIKAQNNTLNKDLAKKEQELIQNQADLAKANKAKASVINNAKDQAAKMREMDTKYKQLTKEKEEITTALQQSQEDIKKARRVFRSNIDQKEKELQIIKLAKDQQTFDERAQTQVKQELDSLKAAHETELQSIQAKNINLQQTLDATNHDMAELRKNASAEVVKLTALNGELTKNTDNIKKLEKANEALTTNNAALQATIRELEATLIKVNNDHANAIIELNNKNDTLNETQKVKISTLTENNKTLQSRPIREDAVFTWLKKNIKSMEDINISKMLLDIENALRKTSVRDKIEMIGSTAVIRGYINALETERGGFLYRLEQLEKNNDPKEAKKLYEEIKTTPENKNTTIGSKPFNVPLVGNNRIIAPSGKA